MSGHTRKILSPERERMILESLESGARGVAELCAAIGVSEATIRRDLDALERKGRVVRVHGGAVKRHAGGAEPLFKEKEGLQAAEKDAIAAAALNLVEDNDTLFLDGGSTVLRLARRLEARRGLTVVTNSLVGPLTAPVLERLWLDKVFLGTLGFTIDSGISTTDPSEAFTKALVMRRARQVVVLADSTKLGVRSFAESGPLADVDVLVTDDAADPAFIEAVEEAGVRVVVAAAPRPPAAAPADAASAPAVR